MTKSKAYYEEVDVKNELQSLQDQMQAQLDTK